MEEGAVGRAVDYFQRNKADAGVICAYNTNPKSSHLMFNDSGQISAFAEKSVTFNGLSCTNFIDVGIIYYREGIKLVNYCADLIDKDIKTNNEYCHGETVNLAIRDQAKVLPYFINEFYNIGTPEGLNDYLKILKVMNPV